ncbi:fasciclin domain-containing protein, partial [Streptomyces sp. NPDC059233]
MSSMKIRRTAIAVAAAALLPFSLAACSDSGKDGASGAGSDEREASASAAGAPDASTAMDKPFGPACAGVPAEGAGSFDGMAKDPVATAASN